MHPCFFTVFLDYATETQNLCCTKIYNFDMIAMNQMGIWFGAVIGPRQFGARHRNPYKDFHCFVPV